MDAAQAWGDFIASLSDYFRHFSFQTLVMAVMMVFLAVGLIDRIRGDKAGYGPAFAAAFHTMGPLALSMVGAIALAPVLGRLLGPVVAPVYRALGASPALFAPTFLAGDMGGYPLAMAMCEGDEALGNFAGLLVGMTLGGTVIFTIPFALVVIPTKDRSCLAAGVLSGILTVPLGVFAGGLAMAATPYALPLPTLLLNMVPVLLPVALVALGLFLWPLGTMRVFSRFGRAVTVLITLGLGAAILQYQTGIRIPFLSLMTEADETGLSPLTTGLLAVGQIAIVLAGALPMMEWIKRTFRRPLERLGRRLSMNGAACAGLVASLANSIPTFTDFHAMNPRGKLLNAAFSVSAAFLLGDHLAYAAAVCPDMILPLLVAKAVGGLSALLLARLLAPRLMKRLGIEEA